MSHSRRDFIKFVVAAPSPPAAPSTPASSRVPDATSSTAPRVEGEHFDICHQVRDGHSFAQPDATRKAEVVIVGGGVAGLSAAYFLRGKGMTGCCSKKKITSAATPTRRNTTAQLFATGSAFAFRGDHGDQLANEIGMKLLPRQHARPTIVNKTFVPTPGTPASTNLPYSKRSRRQLQKIPRRNA